MRKSLTTMAALVMSFSLVAAGCGSSKDESKGGGESISVPTFPAGSTMDAIQKKGRISIGVKYDYIGFGLKNPTSGKLEGFDIEIAKLMAQGIFGGTKDAAESKIDFVEAVTKNREPFLQEGKVDMIVAVYTINDPRKKVIDFAGPYYMAHGDVMVKTSNDSIKSVNDLNGKNVCVVQGSTYPTSLKAKAPQANVTQLENNTQCADALKDGRVDAAAGDNAVLAGITQQNTGQFKLANAFFTDEPYGIGLKKGDQAFRDFVNTRLDTIEKNGAWKTAYESTLTKIGLPASEPPPIDRYTAS